MVKHGSMGRVANAFESSALLLVTIASCHCRMLIASKGFMEGCVTSTVLVLVCDSVELYRSFFLFCSCLYLFCY